MTAALLVCALATAMGWPVARLFEPGSLARAGLAFFIGCGELGLILSILGFLPGGWARAPLAAAILLTAAASLVLTRRLRSEPDVMPAPGKGSMLALLGLAPVAGHALFATAAPLFESDFIENWGLKGRMFFEHGGIDWGFLARGSMEHNHPDYPILVPLLFDAVAIVGGGWNDRAIGLLFTAFAVAFLAVAEARLRQDHPGEGAIVGLAVVALTPLALTPWIGMGDGPLAALLAASALYLRDGLRRDSGRSFAAGAILLGLAALTKNEGMAAIGAAALAVLIASPRRGRDLARLWPAALLASLWIAPKIVLGLSTDLARGPVLQRAMERIADPVPLFEALWLYAAGRPFLWIGIALGVAVAFRHLVTAERFLLVLVAAQAGIYLGAYLVSPHDLAWHVRWSWERLVSHLTLPLAFAVLSGALWTVGGGGRRVNPA